MLLTPGPEPVAMTGTKPSCPARPLLCRALGDRDCLETGQAAGWVKAWGLELAAINHGGDAFDGKTGFSNGGGKDQPPFTRYPGKDQVLLFQGQVAIER